MVVVGPIGLGVRVVAVGAEVVAPEHRIVAPGGALLEAADLLAAEGLLADAVAGSGKLVELDTVEKDRVVVLQREAGGRVGSKR